MEAICVVFVGVLLPVLVAFPLGIGICVWRDASRRNMNGALWALTAGLTPCMVGLLVYLLVRGDHPDLRCPKCGGVVSEEFAVCPRCAAPLRALCPSCGKPVEPGWKVCPFCAEVLPEPVGNAGKRPREKRGMPFWILIFLVLTTGVLLVGVLAVSSLPGAAGSSALGEAGFQEYYEEMGETGERVKEILDDMEYDASLDRACALSWSDPASEDSRQVWLLYVPGAAGSPQRSFSVRSTIFGSVAQLKVAWTGDSGGFYILERTGLKKVSRLSVQVDGKKLDCEVREVEFNPTLRSSEHGPVAPPKAGAAETEGSADGGRRTLPPFRPFPGGGSLEKPGQRKTSSCNLPALGL